MKKRKSFLDADNVNNISKTNIKINAITNKIEEKEETKKKEKNYYFGAKLNKKELDYFLKMQNRHGITKGAVFHLIVAEYMRNHPM